MNTTPNSNRVHIAIYGKRNAGKSSLLNAMIGQDISVVSSIKGTTTDPVKKAMELIPLGPVLFIDTPGIDDSGELGKKRVERSMNILNQTDFAIFVMSVDDLDEEVLKEAKMNFKKFNIPYITVINKIDKLSPEKLHKMKDIYGECMFVSSSDEINIIELKNELVKRIKDNEEDATILGDVVPYDGKVVMVVPVDSEAPKGRIILPQVQLIRDCLDHGIKSYVVRDTELAGAISDLNDIDIVVTDSQAFKRVNEIVPPNIKLTSFSIALSRVKGNLYEFVKGVRAVDTLENGDSVLIAETCTHNTTHEDIGRVKIPRGLRNMTGKDLNIDFRAGQDFSNDISKYKLVIHCAGCMINRKAMQTRINLCRHQNVPITNYGIILAYMTGILDRSIEIFLREDDLYVNNETK